MTIRQKLQRISRFLRSIPNKYYIYGGVALAILLYAVNYLVPKQVTLDYADQTCHKQLTLLPELHRAGDEAYDVSFGESWRVGSTSLASMKTCFTPKRAPQPGSRMVGTAFFNGPVARTLYSISVPKLPSANLSSIKTEVPVSKVLPVTMSTRDTLHRYDLKVGQASTSCAFNNKLLECDVPKLNLAQGQAYDYELTRSFKNQKAQPVGSGTFTTLRAVAITQGSVSPDQTVFARPISFSFTADKPIVKASATIIVDGKPVELETKIENTTLILALKAELPREKSVELTLASVEAKDGSTLVEPYKVAFKTSGGPKVAAVSVGATSVGQSAAIILTFDQPLSKTKDIAPFIAVSGGSASVQKRSDTQVVVQLNALPLCQPFAITVKQGIMSEHDLPSAQNWNFTSRTICYQTVGYGTSLKGRALNAYIFGSSGPVTMYVGGIHGNEPSSTTLMRAWMSELESNPARYSGKRIVIVPAINPDGLAANTRTNSQGVNLNRNFPTDNWVKSIKDTDGSHPNGGGETALSEPEASSLAKLTTSYRPRLLLSFHAIGGLAIGDPGGYSAAYAARYASMVGYRDGTNSGNSNFDYNISGAYEDWTYSKAGIPSIVIELSSYTSVNSAGHYKALWSMLE